MSNKIPYLSYTLSLIFYLIPNLKKYFHLNLLFYLIDIDIEFLFYFQIYQQNVLHPVVLFLLNLIFFLKFFHLNYIQSYYH